MTAFDLAFALLKAPWDVHHWNEGKIGRVEGPLYSGGDKGDWPQYWTEDMEEALAYALYGSAIPRGFGSLTEEEVMNERKIKSMGGMPLRETSPQIWVAPDPGEDRIDPAAIMQDPESEGYMDATGSDVDYEPMPKLELGRLLEDIVSGKRWPPPTLATSGHGIPDEALEEHMKGALERFRTGKSGNLHLPDELMDLVSTSETDQFGGENDIDFNDLEPWQKRLLRNEGWEG